MPAAIDIKPGTRFSHLKVFSRNLDIPPGGGRHWNCVCDCGTRIVRRMNNLRGTSDHSCGCMPANTAGVMDLTRKRFGRLTVVRLDSDKGRTNGAHWICQCSCGKKTSVRASSLTSKNTKSCGCYRAVVIQKGLKVRWHQAPQTDLAGKTFGWLTIVSGPAVGRRNEKYWTCRCKCGKTALVRQRSLVSDHTKSCGCGRMVRKKRVFRADKIPYSKAVKFRQPALRAG